jgi:hypothetical protein
VAGRVGVNPQRLTRVIAAVGHQPAAQAQHPLMLHGQLLDRPHGQIQMQLLRHARRRPQHQPVPPLAAVQKRSIEGQALFGVGHVEGARA